ncbi:MAG: helix-turn-helix domain-containing protein [Pirellulales bacterium]|nr:helix-turn-helix domain-containing protein [Pirellulales bacterium]
MTQRDPLAVLTPPEVGKLLRVAPETVIKWIKTGFLRASNVATGKRPSYRIRPDDLEAFLDRRLVEVPRTNSRRTSL